jgi:hypothetical protein
MGRFTEMDTTLAIFSTITGEWGHVSRDKKFGLYFDLLDKL